MAEELLNNLDSILEFYTERWISVYDEAPPQFGPLLNKPFSDLIYVIEELIRKEELTYQKLKVLLPIQTISLTCDENTEFSLFDIPTIHLISKRCPNFEILHYHKCIKGTDQDDDEISDANTLLVGSILRLDRLQKISLHSSQIVTEIIKVIATRCTNLTELNLLGTNLSDEGLNCLHVKESVIKNSLTTLIIDNTNVTPQSVAVCLINLQNLTHFQYDRTIEACLSLFEDLKNSKISAEVSEFKTIIFKSILDIENSEELLNPEFQKWVIEKFPKVEHLILVSNFLEKNDEFLCKLLQSWKHIKNLELSSRFWYSNWNSFDQLKSSLNLFDKTLTTLKLEGFSNLDLDFLGIFTNLEKLTLINNGVTTSDMVTFKNLKEFEIVYSKYCVKEVSLSQQLTMFDIPYNALLSILSSPSIEKVFIYDQKYFSNTFLEDLLITGCLRKLKILNIFICPIERDGIVELLNALIPIKEINIGFCPFMSIREAEEISTFITNNNFATTFSLALEIPYYLRWLVMDLENPI